MLNLYTLIVASLYTFPSGIQADRYDTALYRLNHMLFKDYDKFTKPVRRSQTVINVTIDFTLNQLLLMNDYTELITLSGWPNIVTFICVYSIASVFSGHTGPEIDSFGHLG